MNRHSSNLFSFLSHAQLSLIGLTFWAIMGCTDPEPVNVAIVGDQVISPLEFKNAYFKFIQQPEVFDSEQNRNYFWINLLTGNYWQKKPDVWDLMKMSIFN